jgi:proline iminopeptidase
VLLRPAWARAAPHRVADADWVGVTHATWADDCDAVRAALGAERVLVFGHSYGGVLALEYALRHPARVAGLVLCTTQPAFDYAEQALALARARATPAQWDLLLASLANPPADDAALAAGARALLPLYLHAPRPETLALFDAVRFRAAPYRHAMARLLPALDLRRASPGFGCRRSC